MSESGIRATDWNHKFNDSLRLQIHVPGGFANGSPDYGVGAKLKYTF